MSAGSSRRLCIADIRLEEIPAAARLPAACARTCRQPRRHGYGPQRVRWFSIRLRRRAAVRRTGRRVRLRCAAVMPTERRRSSGRVRAGSVFQPWFDWKRPAAGRAWPGAWLLGWVSSARPRATRRPVTTTALGNVLRINGIVDLDQPSGQGSRGASSFASSTAIECSASRRPRNCRRRHRCAGAEHRLSRMRRDFDLDISVLNWTQGFRNETIGIAVGRLAFDRLSRHDAVPDRVAWFRQPRVHPEPGDCNDRHRRARRGRPRHCSAITSSSARRSTTATPSTANSTSTRSRSTST